MKIKKNAILIFSLLICLLLIGCSKFGASGQGGKKVIKIGIRADKKTVLQEVKKDFDQKGYKLEIVVFDDALTPNIALAEGSIHANFYQHLPYLERFNIDRKTNLTYTGKRIIFGPIHMYSSKISSLDELVEGSVIAIPEDVTNQEKALKLLVEEGLVVMEEGAERYSVLNIAKNVKGLKLIEMAQTQMPRSIDDVDGIVLNMNYMQLAGYDIKNTVTKHTSGEDYPVIIAIRSEDKNEKWAKDLEDAFTSEHMRQFYIDEFGGCYNPLF